MANMDRVFDWLLTKEKEAHIEEKNPTKVMSKDEKTRILAHEPRNTDRTEPLFYFADVCAGPGGFTEYVLWRKAFYNAKGFGMTLKGFVFLLSKLTNLQYIILQNFTSFFSASSWIQCNGVFIESMLHTIDSLSEMSFS